MSRQKNINAEKLLAPQSVCENVKIFRIFYSVMIQASSGMPVVFVRNSYHSKG